MNAIRPGITMCITELLLVILIVAGSSVSLSAANRFPSRDCSPPCCKEMWNPASPTGVTMYYQCVTGNLRCKIECRMTCQPLDVEAGPPYQCSKSAFCGGEGLCLIYPNGDPAGCAFPQEPQSACEQYPPSCSLNCDSDLLNCGETGYYKNCMTSRTILKAWVQR